LWVFRGFAVLGLTIFFAGLFYVLLQQLSARVALLLYWAIYLIYIQTPWEIFNTYMFQAAIFAILSLHFYWRKPYLAILLAAASLAMKVTIGGSIFIAFFLTYVFGLLCKIFGSNARILNFRNNQILLISGGVLLSFALPILALKSFGIDVATSEIFTNVFSGESKGGLLLSLQRPFLSFLSFLDLVPREISTGFGFLPIRIVYSYLGISIIFPILWMLLLVSFTATTIHLFLNRQINRAAFFLPIILSCIGASYASAMSGNFKPDDVFLLAFAFLSCYRYIVRPNIRRLYLYACFSIPSIFLADLLVRETMLLFAASLCFLTAAFLISRKVSEKALIFGAVFFGTVAIKCYASTFSWWEHNIRGKQVTSVTMGFLATPYYGDLIKTLQDLNEVTKKERIPRSVFSFPTSSLPYHVFGYLPPWQYTVHHGDVFPKSRVDAEFRSISNENPAFMVISRWMPEKIAEFDSVFAPTGKSSQHEMSLLIDGLINERYILCASVVSDPAKEPNTYNHPTEIYARTDLLDISSALLAYCRSTATQPR
jgi:hypothetical protein